MSEENQTGQPAKEAAENQEVQQTAENVIANSISLNTIVGVKEGMTRIFDTNGTQIPVTVVRLIPNVITQVKTDEKDGYTAYQIGYYNKREALVKKPVKGHLKKAGTDQKVTRFREVKVDSADSSNLGAAVSLDAFGADTFVDISGSSKGKGFQGVVKRHGFSIGPKAHGSKFHRTGGSIGNCATPGKVFKGKKMPGQMGNKKTTVQNLKVVELNEDKGYMLIKGSVPGSKKGFVTISKSVKKHKVIEVEYGRY